MLHKVIQVSTVNVRLSEDRSCVSFTVVDPVDGPWERRARFEDAFALFEAMLRTGVTISVPETNPEPAK